MGGDGPVGDHDVLSVDRNAAGADLATMFDEAGNPFSDGALKAIEEAKTALFRSDQKQISEPEAMCRSVEAISGVAWAKRSPLCA